MANLILGVSNEEISFRNSGNFNIALLPDKRDMTITYKYLHESQYL